MASQYTKILEKSLTKFTNWDTSLLNFSIFPPKYTSQNNIKSLILDSKLSVLQDKGIGSLYGLAIADSFGHTTEFLPVTYELITHTKLTAKCFESPHIENMLELKAGQWTDDTSMALCLADSLIHKNTLDLIDIRERFLAWFCNGYNNPFRLDEKRKNKRSVGLGRTCKDSLRHFIETKGKAEYMESPKKNQDGNGTIMRLAPVPIFYHNDLNKSI